MGKRVFCIGCLLLLAVPWLSGCGRAGKPRVLVLAAASTTDAIEEAARDFTEQTGVEVKVSPGPSNALARQVLSGSPADLFLSASVTWAEEVARGGQEAKRRNLLSNRLVLVVPAGNPAGVHSPKDLLSSAVKRVALAGEGVPAGNYAGQALRSLGLYQRLIESHRVVRGHDVRATLAYVEKGEAEAGIVYATDARITDQVTEVYTFPPGTHGRIVYTVTLLKDAAGREAAQSFYDYLFSPAAGRIFEKHGFRRL
jgi:molybdate transport system substrate-binding protein